MTWCCCKWSNWCKNWWSKWKQVKEPFFALCLANIIFHCYCYCLLTYYKRVRTQSKGNVPIDTINYQWLATLKCLQKSTTSFNIQYLFIFKKCLFFLHCCLLLDCLPILKVNKKLHIFAAFKSLIGCQTLDSGLLCIV